MRILSVGNRYPPWSFGGYETIWQRANAALRAAGHDVRVLSTVADPTDHAGDAPEPDVHRELRWYWRAHAFPRPRLRRVRPARARQRRRARRAPARVSPRRDRLVGDGRDVAVAARARPRGRGPRGRRRRRSSGCPTDPQVDGWIRRWRGWRRAAGPVAERLTGLPARVDLDRGARWVFISAHLLEAARAATAPRSPGAVVAHPGIDPAPFPRRARGPSGSWRLLYCGRVDPRKGVATAVRALAQLPAARR